MAAEIRSRNLGTVPLGVFLDRFQLRKTERGQDNHVFKVTDATDVSFIRHPASLSATLVGPLLY
ncbi:hypothetical protein OUZ56_027767 [Daphnia magna]|uniref:Uncharacterized protein n=1 Tax=Daphnia magna TaxID=35525 RepID=A0ABR0B1V8_9CRUS|nr:hypothetical protein OUZ56_027767 [Daphnia magna]